MKHMLIFVLVVLALLDVLTAQAATHVIGQVTDVTTGQLLPAIIRIVSVPHEPCVIDATMATTNGEFDIAGPDCLATAVLSVSVEAIDYQGFTGYTTGAALLAEPQTIKLARTTWHSYLPFIYAPAAEIRAAGPACPRQVQAVHCPAGQAEWTPQGGLVNDLTGGRINVQLSADQAHVLWSTQGLRLTGVCIENNGQLYHPAINAGRWSIVDSCGDLRVVFSATGPNAVTVQGLNAQSLSLLEQLVSFLGH